MAITVEARREFVRGCTGVSIWLSRRLRERGMSFRDAVTKCSAIYRFTTLWDEKNHPANPPAGWRNEKWEGVLDRLEEMDRRYAAGDAGMEAEALEMLWPLMEG